MGESLICTNISEDNHCYTIKSMMADKLAMLFKGNGNKIVPEYERLPADQDPIVKYKLQRLKSKRGSQGSLQYNAEDIQKEIELGVSPSGRKLETYSSGSGEECVYKRVECRDDPEFDLINPCLDFGTDGEWPNPFLFYWNCKEADEDENVDEPYLDHRVDKEVDVRRKEIAEKLEADIMAIPYYRIGLDDTDASDPEELKIFSSNTRISQKKKNTKKRNSKDSELSEVESHTQFHKHHWKHYQNKFDIINQHYSRKYFALKRKLKGNYTSGVCCCKYPFWYSFFWKKVIRRIVRRIPRERKFMKDRNTETLFYGSLASLYGTQYIPEFDLLPNMDDPVLTSQIALEKAMEIKEKFLVNADSNNPYVDYLKLQRSMEYDTYNDCISMMCRYQPVKMPPRVRKVFFLNFFNVLSIHTQIWRIPEKQNMRYLWEMKNFWEKTEGLAGCVELSLEKIYHGILRCNKMQPKKQARVFAESVAKGLPKEMCLTRLSLDYLDPRIHFALNIGCKSCPPIQIFSLYEQDFQLDEVAKTYVRTRVKIDEPLRTVTLPILFLWYEKDFGNNQRVLLWYLKRFLLAKDALKIRQLVTSKKAIRFRYTRFDYELDPVVRRHPPFEFSEIKIRRKIIPVYWGSRL